jgi:hypothetical protein
MEEDYLDIRRSPCNLSSQEETAMEHVAIELVVPLSTSALCLIGGATAAAIAALTVAVVGLFAEVKRLKEQLSTVTAITKQILLSEG